mgnify:CR=1 FL=1
MFEILQIYYYLFYRTKIFYPKKSYSLFGEDTFIINYFKNKPRGFYIDVGCYHPLEGSNTHLLYKKGWKGINFDISDFSIKLFKFLRKRDISIRSGISNYSGKKQYYFRKKINMLNTLNENIGKIHFKNGYNTDVVNINTLDFFLEKFFKKNIEIDLLKIDVEGEELNVLKSIDLKHFKPQLISIEIHNKENMFDDSYEYYKNDEIYIFLQKLNYDLIWKNQYSFIFDRK